MILTTPIHPSFLNNSILPCDSASMIVIAASQSNHLLIAKSQHQAKMESSQTLVYVFPNQPRVFTTTIVTVVTVPLELAATVVLNKTVFLGNPPPPTIMSPLVFLHGFMFSIIPQLHLLFVRKVHQYPTWKPLRH